MAEKLQPEQGQMNNNIEIRKVKKVTEGRRSGDRWDGRLIRDIDPMHFIMPMIYPGRCDNEAFISEKLDLTNVNKYLEKKNAELAERVARGEAADYKYNLFQFGVTTILKTLTLRPKMNRFIANKNIYQREEVSASFIVKKLFADDGAEALAIIHSLPEDTIDDIHNQIYAQVSTCRSDKVDSSSESMDIFKRMPRWFSRALVSLMCVLDRHGKVPYSLIETDPYYTSVVLSNLGSIKLHSGYHHLTNWGTNSVFVAIGEKKPRIFQDENGEAVLRDSLDLGLTVDERIADGYYYSKTMRLVRKIFECPELLDEPLNQPFEY